MHHRTPAHRRFTTPRSRWLAPAVLTTLTALGISPQPAHAQAWPVKAIRLVVPYAAGSPPDISSRIVATPMAQALGQSIVVENKPGAAGTIGARDALRQPADGYTLLTLLSPVVAGQWLVKEPGFDLRRDLAAIGQYDWTYAVLVTNPAVKASNVSELITLIRAQPDAFSFASGGHGTPAHLAGELFKLQNNLRATHIPFGQGNGIPDLIAGRVQYMFLASPLATQQVRSGRLRALAVAAGANRLPSLPDVPTMAEQGFRTFDVRNWTGLVARAGTPRPVIERLNTELRRALAGEATASLTKIGSEPHTGTPEEFATLIGTEFNRIGDLITRTGIRLE